MAGLLQSISLELPKVALIAVETEALSQKGKNGAVLVREEFDKLQAESEQTRNYRKMLEENVVDLEENIVPIVDNISKVSKELFDDMTEIEGSEELIAEARAASQKQSDKTKRTRMAR